MGTGRCCPCPHCCRPPRPRAQLPSPLPGRVPVMKSSAPPGSLLAPGAARPGRWLCRGRGDRGRRAPRLLPRPFPGCSGAAAHRLLPGRPQTKEEKLPPCALAWEHGAALAAACRRCPRPHKAALLGEEQNLCPAPSRKVCAAKRPAACPPLPTPCPPLHAPYLSQPCPARSVPTPARAVPTPACTTPPLPCPLQAHPCPCPPAARCRRIPALPGRLQERPGDLSRCPAAGPQDGQRQRGAGLRGSPPLPVAARREGQAGGPGPGLGAGIRPGLRGQSGEAAAESAPWRAAAPLPWGLARAPSEAAEGRGSRPG